VLLVRFFLGVFFFFFGCCVVGRGVVGVRGGVGGVGEGSGSGREEGGDELCRMGDGEGG
jgi:hypothetical protein